MNTFRTDIIAGLRGVRQRIRNWGFDAPRLGHAVREYRTALEAHGLPCAELEAYAKLIDVLPRNVNAHAIVGKATAVYLQQLGIMPPTGMRDDDFATSLDWSRQQVQDAAQSAALLRRQRTSLAELATWTGPQYLVTPQPHIPPYEIVTPDPQTTGGTGRVYAVRDTRFIQYMAVKVVDPLPNTALHDRTTVGFERTTAHFSQVDHALTLFREMAYQGKARETEFAQVRQIGRSDAPHYAPMFSVMDWKNGKTLRGKTWHASQLRHPYLQLRLARKVVAAVAACHRRHIVHRDIKEANFLMQLDLRNHLDNPVSQLQAQWSASVHLADFGIACHILQAPDQNPITGTNEYLAPELFFGTKPSYRTDVYSLGVTLHRLFTTRSPYRTPWARLRDWQHGMTRHPGLKVERNGWKDHQDVRHGRRYLPSLLGRPSIKIGYPLPPLLRDIILRAVDRNPLRRYADAPAMLAAIDERLHMGRTFFPDGVSAPFVLPANPAGPLMSPLKARVLAEEQWEELFGSLG